MCDFVIVRSGAALIVVGSIAVSLAVFVSPPPDTVTLLVSEAAAEGETLTVSVIAGKLKVGARTAFVVQVSVARVQVQPDPLRPVAVRPAGRVSTAVTVPVVDPPPELETVIV